MVGRDPKYVRPADEDVQVAGEVDGSWENKYETEFGLADNVDELMEVYDSSTEADAYEPGAELDGQEPVVDPAEANDGMGAFAPNHGRSPFDH